ncbi:hypothetical protein PQX77_015704 [Marasmius sp. AFHP31]|nr:hypothetical protein PQX77_015704 [Marasmius sp. AFHP31]
MDTIDSPQKSWGPITSHVDGHFIANGQLFTSTHRNGRIPDDIPARNALHFTEPNSTSRFREFNWIHDSHPFMALVPLWNPFKEDLFACLHRCGDRFPSYRKGHAYRLARDLAKDWDALELGMKRLVNGLLEEADPGGLIFSKSFSLWSFPAHYGYNLSHNSAQELQAAVEESRDAFLPLIAAATLALCCLERRKLVEPDFIWRERMLRVHQLHPEWLSSLERSYATGKQILRIGGILDASTPERRRRARGLVALYSMVNVSVCIYWGSVETAHTSSLRTVLDTQGSSRDINHQEAVKFAVLVPSDQNMEKLRRGQQQGREEWPSPTRCTVNSLSPLPLNERVDEENELVERNSGQLPGETWKEFFERRDMRREGRQESDTERQARLSRESYAKAKLCPGRRGASVWYWELRGKQRVRTLLTRNEHEGYWNDYGKEQKKFDAWNNCWDICTEFGDRDEDQDDFLDIEDGDMIPNIEDMNMSPAPAQDGRPGEDGPSHLTDEPRTPSVPDAQGDIEREDGEVEQLAPESPSVDLLTDSGLKLGRLRCGMEDLTYQVEDLAIPMDTVAFERYGFKGDPVDLGLANERINWETARKLLGNGKWLDSPYHDQFKENSQSPELRDELCRHLYLLQHTPANSYMNIPSLDFANSDSTLHAKMSWAFDVRKVNVDSETRYMLQMKSTSRASSDQLALLLFDAAAVVHIARVDMGETVPEIAGQLLNYGIRFNVLRKGPRPGDPQMARKTNLPGMGSAKCVLGYRSSEYSPDVIDLRTYTGERDRFLRSNRGRAAASYGGIVGRIARAVVPDSEVVHGPDPDLVYRFGRCFLNAGDSGFWDDELTAEEIDLVCGVYVVETGKASSSNISQAAQMSWWPRPAHFEAGGLNLEFWTADCEKWFQNRVRECAYKPKLFSATQWRKAMAMQHSLRRLHSSYQKISSRFLDEMFP